MKSRWSAIVCFLLVSTLLCSQQVLAQAQLRSGPMLGYSTMHEVAVWVQTDEAVEVQLRFWPISDIRDVHYSAVAKTDAATAFCATLLADSLIQGTTYEYQVLINHRALTTDKPLQFKTQELWSFRKDPPDFTFALGSCYYANEEAYDRPGKPYGGGYEIFRSIDSLKPDMMLWLGDNIYLRKGDDDSKSGIFHRYSHSRAIPELKGLLRHANHYAIWDDHDYGPNDSDRSYIHKDWTAEAFDLFWANPHNGHPDLNGINANNFIYNDVEFFLLDNRSQRAPNECKTCDGMPLLGDAQLNWLIDALVRSTASYKFVVIGGQVLNPAQTFENYAHHHGNERKRLLDRIAREGIKNVVFLSGDRHHTELTRMEMNGLALYDFTVSPLTSGATSANQNEGNVHRVEGTFVGERNFGTVTIGGPLDDRKATLRIYNTQGGLLWEREL